MFYITYVLISYEYIRYIFKCRDSGRVNTHSFLAYQNEAKFFLPQGKDIRPWKGQRHIVTHRAVLLRPGELVAEDGENEADGNSLHQWQWEQCIFPMYKVPTVVS